MGRQNVYNYSSSDSEPASSAQPPRRRHHHRRRWNRTQVPALETVAASPQPSSSTSSGSNKKSQKPPQESIDSIWDKFSQKKFSKALAILPFSPVQASTSGERGNELLQAGYERAADECRRKVRKIITECKRVNTSYRDPGWDLDWDIIWEKGHTLNSLTNQMFDISHANLCNPAANVPKAVKRIREVFEKPTFMENILPGDIKQGQLDDCWFVASLTALANVPGGVRRLCVEHDTKIGIYGFVFYRDGEWIYSIIDDKLFLKSPCWDSPSMQRHLLQLIDREDVERVYRQTYQTGSHALYFAQNKDEHETWVPLVEKAYAKAHGDYVSLAGGWVGEALEDLSGGVTTEILASDILDIDAFWTNELSKVNDGFLFGCSTGLVDGGYGARDGIAEGHTYVIMDAKELKDGTRLCKLRNPWGTAREGNWEGAWSDGSKEWTAEAQEELSHTFGSDSTFWIPYEDLLRKYLHFDRTRLFRDPEWRSCQRWIGVEVPWNPQYNEKFHLTLTRESPVVLVLAQLDDRYFRDLEGQYQFRLQFRVHADGAPGAEEYIVRSHGNYLMDRSVSIELPALGAGSYAVYISISGERDTGLESTEAVVLSECADREENEKLAQVGQAYDLAHSKAAAHLDRLLKVRTKAEGKKASEARMEERRKEWEKRQIQRAIAGAQKVKNEAKKAEGKRCKRAKAKDEAEAKAKEKADAKAKLKSDAEAKEAAEKEAQGQADQLEPQPSHKSTQADSDLTRGESQAAVDAESASTTSTSSSSTEDPQDTPQDSPELKTSTPVKDQTTKVAVPFAEPPATTSSAEDAPQPAPTAPPAPSIPINVHQALELKLHYCSCRTCKPPPAVEDSDGYSSDSPVEDYEDLYDSDDMRTSIRAPAPTSPTDTDDSDDEDAPDPWNAIAVVGFRVYSKDEGLELRVVLEGGELEQHGMGNLGEADLDNAVTNAAGQREKKKKKGEEGEKVVESGVGGKDGETDAEAAGEALPNVKVHARGGGADVETKNASQQGDNTAAKAAYHTIVERKTSEFDRVVGKTKDGKSNQDAPAENSAVAEAPAKAPTPVQQQHKSADQKSVQTRTSAENDVPKTPQPPTTTVPASLEKPTRDMTKEVLSIRARLQSICRDMLAAPTHHQPPGEDAMQAMSESLGKLESLPDLEAGVILATRIHKVMVAILKLGCLPTGGDDLVFSNVARAQRLLDDYELTLMTSEDAGSGGW